MNKNFPIISRRWASWWCPVVSHLSLFSTSLTTFRRSMLSQATKRLSPMKISVRSNNVHHPGTIQSWIRWNGHYRSSLPHCIQINVRNISKHFKKRRQRNSSSKEWNPRIELKNRFICAFRTDRKNVLSDIDSMLSDLNRELDQMLDYETSTSLRS